MKVFQKPQVLTNRMHTSTEDLTDALCAVMTSCKLQHLNYRINIRLRQTLFDRYTVKFDVILLSEQPHRQAWIQKNYKHQYHQP